MCGDTQDSWHSPGHGRLALALPIAYAFLLSTREVFVGDVADAGPVESCLMIAMLQVILVGPALMVVMADSQFVMPLPWEVPGWGLPMLMYTLVSAIYEPIELILISKYKTIGFIFISVLVDALSIAFSAFLLGEPFSPQRALGAGIVLIGVVVEAYTSEQDTSPASKQEEQDSVEHVQDEVRPSPFADEVRHSAYPSN